MSRTATNLEDIRSAMLHGTGAGVRVAIIDSGIEAGHPGLAGMRLRDSIAILEERGRLVVREDDGIDAYGHGTGVASVLLRTAPEAEVGSFRVLDARNLSRAEVIRQGVREALSRGYHIINCSFGSKGGVRTIMTFKEWVDDCWLRGVHVVSACNNYSLYEPEWPGHFASTLTVSMARTNSDHFFYRPGHLVQFSAQGENVEVAWLDGRFERRTGSSFAVPRLSGCLARLMSAMPDITPALAHELLPKLAHPWSPELEFV